MYEIKKTLIVVYKDELLMNQLKKMIETHDDNKENIIGTKDDSIDIVSWTEKVWIVNKKAGNIQGKILFLGDIKDTDKLIPVIDIKFDDCGVKYGWAGNQAIVYANLKDLTTHEDYATFLKKLYALPVPDFLKATKESIAATGTDLEPEATIEQTTDDTNNKTDINSIEVDEKKQKKNDLIESLKSVISTGTEVLEKVGTQVAPKFEEIFRNKSLMKRQMLFYGVVSLYNDGLEKFMNT